MSRKEIANIRRLAADDILNIDNMFIKQGWESRLNVLENYLADQNNDERVVLIAEKDDVILGYITLMKVAKHGPFLGLYPEVADFNVFEDFQKMGIGKTLLEKIEVEASKISNVITIGVGLHKGYGPAQRLYIKQGYVPDGSGVWFNNENIDMNVSCINNDDLVLYFSKQIK